MKKIIFAGLSLAMLAGPVSQADASTGRVSLYEQLIDSPVDFLVNNPKTVGLVVTGVVAMIGIASYALLNAALTDAQQFLDGSFDNDLASPSFVFGIKKYPGRFNTNSSFLLKVIKKNTSDISKAERALKHFNGCEYNAIIAVNSFDSLRSDISLLEHKLNILSPYLWFSSLKVKLKHCMSELAQAREFVGDVIYVLKTSELYKTQIAEQKANVRQKHDDKIELRQAHTRQIIYTDVKPTPVVNLAS